MKKRDLEIRLQQIPPPPNPKVHLEQYQTPAPIAADILYNAYILGDIKDNSIIDLGCGTGIFSVGASLLGAKSVTGIDIDAESIKIAKHYATTHNLEIDYITSNITEQTKSTDTIIMNPPFGAQKSHKNADRIFLEVALSHSTITYSLHLSDTLDFLQKITAALDSTITHTKTYQWPLKAQYHFHEKLTKTITVDLLRIQKNSI